MPLTINKKLLPLKIHYFFKYGGIAFFTLLPVVCRQKGIPETGVGLMWSVTPLASCGINLVCSALADKLKIYRAMFIGALVVLSVTFLTVFTLPDIGGFIPNVNNVTSAPPSLCYMNESSLNVLSSSDWLVFQDCENISSSDWITSEHGDTDCILQCNYTSEIEQGISNHTSFHLPGCLNKTWLTDESRLYDICETSDWAAIIKSESENRTNVYDLCVHEFRDVPCTRMSYSSDLQHPTKDPPMPLSQLLKTPIFWMIFLLLLFTYGGNSTSTTMADTICFAILGSDRHKYGRQRMWGSLGWGLMGFIGGALVDIYSKGQDYVNYTPALILASIFLGCNLLVSIKIPFKLPDKEKLKASRVGKALCSFKMIVFLVTVVVVGLNMGILWTFLFIIVEDVASLWDPDFQHIKLIQGLMLGTSCFLGEVPSLFLSPIIVKKLGHVNTFGLALLGFTLRAFLYFSVVNPWYFIPIDLTHGISFGLFYPNMISYASLMAPTGAQATVQGIVKSLLIVGVSLGGLGGGLLVTAIGGSNTFLVLGLTNVIYTLAFVALQFAIHRMDKAEAGEEDVIPAESLMGEPVKNKGLNIVLGVEEQGSMYEINVITPYSALPQDNYDLKDMSIA